MAWVLTERARSAHTVASAAAISYRIKHVTCESAMASAVPDAARSAVLDTVSAAEDAACETSADTLCTDSGTLDGWSNADAEGCGAVSGAARGAAEGFGADAGFGGSAGCPALAPGASADVLSDTEGSGSDCGAGAGVLLRVSAPYDGFGSSDFSNDGAWRKLGSSKLRQLELWHLECRFAGRIHWRSGRWHRRI